MTWLTWPARVIIFHLWFAREFLIANTAVIKDNITPGQDSTPGIARYDTQCRTDAELTLLGALITITPGTLTLGTTDATAGAPRALYVHSMYSQDADTLRSELHDMENHLLHALRRKGHQP
ncbi:MULTISPECIES: Na+/H+ antiporter subunit E [Dietzia]|uniref:Na+/H+ antiporter subunit E n=2 Tax=Dietzia TaxID=37914 RepID=A0ABT8GZ47_9ACTN|nr:Na+/H+ antiporter subunit E [Dietzia maris]MDN4504989.1 Na+/H+ antiporter subunit E [Dietzia maris]